VPTFARLNRRPAPGVKSGDEVAAVAPVYLEGWDPEAKQRVGELRSIQRQHKLAGCYRSVPTVPQTRMYFQQLRNSAEVLAYRSPSSVPAGL